MCWENVQGNHCNKLYISFVSIVSKKLNTIHDHKRLLHKPAHTHAVPHRQVYSPFVLRSTISCVS